jgi:aspartate-semialdehyde dehydrogenase
MKLAVVGATGLVGQEILKVLEERSFPFDELYLVASAKSVGQTITFKGKNYVVRSVQTCCGHCNLFSWRRNVIGMGS